MYSAGEINFIVVLGLLVYACKYFGESFHDYYSLPDKF